MAHSVHKRLAEALLKALIAAAETSKIVKFTSTFVAELSSRFSDLPDEDWTAVIGSTPDAIHEALTPIDLATYNAAYAAAKADQIEHLVQQAIQSQMVGERILDRFDSIRERLQRDIDDERQRGHGLQQTLDAERRRGHELAGGVRMASRWARDAARTRPEVLELARALTEAVGRYESAVPSTSRSADDDLRLRLARATAANAAHQFDEALRFVSEEEGAAEFDTARDRVERAVEVNRVRGDALYGLREWSRALACFERILSLRPKDLGARFVIANCLRSLGRVEDALRHNDALVDELTRLVEEEGRAELANDLAMAHNNRGNARRNLGQHESAIADFDEAIAIRTRLVEEEGRAELASDLASTHNNRGIARGDLGQHESAIADFDKAIAIYTRLVDDEGRAELANDLAMARNNRGNARGDLGQHESAIADFDKAIAIYTRLVEVKGRHYLANKLDLVKHNREIAPVAWRGAEPS